MPELNEIMPLPTQRPDVLEFLGTRRSNLVKLMDGAGPNKDQLDAMLTIAARVPDHRKLAPWRFLIFEGEARTKIGHHIKTKFKADNPDLPDDRAEFEAERFKRAPTVVAVISSPKDCHRGTPEWEQRLSSAVVCYNLCLAAQATGFGAQWLTEWMAYDRDILGHMGLETHEKMAGFVYIGTAIEGSKERPRPSLPDLVQHWT